MWRFLAVTGCRRGEALGLTGTPSTSTPAPRRSAVSERSPAAASSRAHRRRRPGSARSPSTRRWSPRCGRCGPVNSPSAWRWAPAGRAPGLGVLLQTGEPPGRSRSPHGSASTAGARPAPHRCPRSEAHSGDVGCPRRSPSLSSNASATADVATTWGCTAMCSPVTTRPRRRLRCGARRYAVTAMPADTAGTCPGRARCGARAHRTASTVP